MKVSKQGKLLICFNVLTPEVRFYPLASLVQCELIDLKLPNIW